MALLHGESAAAAGPFDHTLLSEDDEEDVRLRVHLDTLDREALIALLWEHAVQDPELYGKLQFHAAASRQRRPRRVG